MLEIILKKVIEKLKKLNKNILMLTGDNEITANIIANVSSKEKSNKINELKEKRLKAMMIGDKINDAPSLSNADIGVSINSAVDIAADSANIILIKNNRNRRNDVWTLQSKSRKINFSYGKCFKSKSWFKIKNSNYIFRKKYRWWEY